MSVKRGEIYWMDFEPVKGSEQGGLRPALIVQNDTGNRHSNTTIVAAVTRTIPHESYPFIVIVEPDDAGLPVRSAINCAQLATVQQTGETSRLRPAKGQATVRPIGKLSEERMREVDAALAYSLGIR